MVHKSVGKISTKRSRRWIMPIVLFL